MTIRKNDYVEERKAFSFMGKAISQHLLCCDKDDKSIKQVGRRLEKEFPAEINDATHAEWIRFLRCMFSSSRLDRLDLLDCTPFCFHHRIRTALHQLLSDCRHSKFVELEAKLPQRAKVSQPKLNEPSRAASRGPEAGVPNTDTLTVAGVGTQDFYALATSTQSTGDDDRLQQAGGVERRVRDRNGPERPTDSALSSSDAASIGATTPTALPAANIRVGPDDVDIAAARRRAIARAPFSALKVSPADKSWSWYDWGPDIISKVRSCAVLNYFDFIVLGARLQAETAKGERWFCRWQCRCCHLVYDV
ncbi:hypothetical protein V8E36_000040, partial [Tilletia maclaganii]